MAADLVLYGDIVTMHEESPRAQALAVTGGRITAVGARTDVEELVGPDTRVVDVGGATVLPGFIEPHGHPLEEAIVLGPDVVDIRPVTIAEADAVVAAVVDTVRSRGA
ncbi:MAG: amidohydrolase, partial [Rhodococcus sp. (in: high G+C Gram-positive bacteria)]